MRARLAGLIAGGVLVASVAACGKSEQPRASSSSQSPSASAAAPATAQTSCPATGWWAQCSVVYALERAGVAPKLDTVDTAPEQKLLTGKMFVVKVGQLARLEVYLYPDSASRIADEKTLDRTQFVSDTTDLTIKRERTLIENANLVGLFTSLNSHQRQRVGDALLAGPPQPATKQ